MGKEANHSKHKLLDEIQNGKQLKKQCSLYQKELKKKKTDIQRLKSAMWNLNKYICSNTNSNISRITPKEPGSDRVKENVSLAMDTTQLQIDLMMQADESLNNVTSLSFDHDLDLEDNVGSGIESTKSNIVINKRKKIKSKSKKYNTMSTTCSSLASSPDMLKEITTVLTNQRRSRHSLGSKAKKKITNAKRIKQAKHIKNGSGKSKRSFIPKKNGKSDRDLNSSSRARRIAINGKQKIKSTKQKSSDHDKSSSVVKQA